MSPARGWPTRAGRTARPFSPGTGDWPAPIALCEVEGYAYEAALAGAELLEAFGLDGSERWRQLMGTGRPLPLGFLGVGRKGPYPAVVLQGDGTPWTR